MSSSVQFVGILNVCFADDKMCLLIFNRSFIDQKKEVAPNSKVLCFSLFENLLSHKAGVKGK